MTEKGFRLIDWKEIFKINLLLICIAVFLGTSIMLNSSPAKAADKTDDNTIVAEIGATKITLKEFKAKLNETPGYAQKRYEGEEGKKSLLDNIIKGELLYYAAKEEKLDQEAEIKEKINEAVKRILQGEYYNRVMKSKGEASEDKIQSYYNSHKEEFKTEARVKVAHILLGSKEDAEKVKKELEKGAKFEDLAKEKSLDETTRDNGGLLGYITEEGYIRSIGKSPEFEKAAFATQQDHLSEIVKTDKGFHIIKVLEKRDATYRPLEEVKPRIVDSLIISDEDVKKYYDAHKDEFIEEEKVKVSHILFDNEKDALKAKKEIENGADFAALAKERSLDESTARQGGSLGFITKDQFIRSIGKSKEFEDTAFALELNQVSNPVKTTKGWHLIQLNDKKAKQEKDFELVKGQIRNKLLGEARNAETEKAFEELRAKYNVKINDEALKSIQ